MNDNNELARLVRETQEVETPSLSISAEFFEGIASDTDTPANTLEISAGQLRVCNSLTPRVVAETLRCCLGLFRPRPETVLLFGQDLGKISERRARRLRRRMGVCGGPLELDPSLSVTDNLALPCQLKGLSRKQTHSRIERISETLHLDELLGLNVGRLGFVERRIVALARALAHDPELALLEAPLVGLQNPQRSLLLGALRRLAVTGAAVLIFNDESPELQEDGSDEANNTSEDIFTD